MTPHGWLINSQGHWKNKIRRSLKLTNQAPKQQQEYSADGSTLTNNTNACKYAWRPCKHFAANLHYPLGINCRRHCRWCEVKMPQTNSELTADTADRKTRAGVTRRFLCGIAHHTLKRHTLSIKSGLVITSPVENEPNFYFCFVLLDCRVSWAKNLIVWEFKTKPSSSGRCGFWISRRWVLGLDYQHCLVQATRRTGENSATEFDSPILQKLRAEWLSNVASRIIYSRGCREVFRRNARPARAHCTHVMREHSIALPHARSLAHCLFSLFHSCAHALPRKPDRFLTLSLATWASRGGGLRIRMEALLPTGPCQREKAREWGVKARLHMRFFMRFRCDFANKTCHSLPRTSF